MTGLLKITINNGQMKKTVSIIAVLLTCMALHAQTNPIDQLFDKYSDKEGFTSVYISGKMFGLFAGADTGEVNPGRFLSRIKSIRILTEDSICVDKVNFYTELAKKVDFSAYEELMVVRDPKEITKFLVRQKGNTISELLVITGGPGKNTLISIRGDIDLKSLSSMSQTLGIEELGELEKAEKKNP